MTVEGGGRVLIGTARSCSCVLACSYRTVGAVEGLLDGRVNGRAVPFVGFGLECAAEDIGVGSLFASGVSGRVGSRDEFAFDRRHQAARAAAAFVGDEDVGVVERGLVDAVSVDLTDDTAHPVIFQMSPQRPGRIIIRGRAPTPSCLNRSSADMVPNCCKKAILSSTYQT